MSSLEIKTAEDALRVAHERGLSHVNIGLFDLDGLLLSKRISLSKLESVFEKRLMFCDVIYGWDLQDQIYDNVTFTGWHTGFPDCPVAILPETFRELPFEPDGMLFLGQLEDEGGPGAGRALHPDLPAVLFDQLLADGQPQPGAALGPRVRAIQLPELLEQP